MISSFEYWFRLLLYAAIAAVTSLITDITEIANGVDMSPAHHWLIGLKAFLAGAIAVRAFIDKSPARRMG